MRKGKVLVSIMSILLFINILLVAFSLTEKHVFPDRGITVHSQIYGMYMYPTIKEGALFLTDETPFEDLQVRDIICFRKQINANPFNFVITEDMMVNGVAKVSISPDDPNGTYYDKGISYDDYNVVHRIVSINELGDRTLFTQGDGNDGSDYRAVLKSGYVGKVIWYANWLGYVYRFFYEYGGFVAISIISFGFMIATARMWWKKIKEEEDVAKSTAPATVAAPTITPAATTSAPTTSASTTPPTED